MLYPRNRIGAIASHPSIRLRYRRPQFRYNRYHHGGFMSFLKGLWRPVSQAIRPISEEIGKSISGGLASVISHIRHPGNDPETVKHRDSLNYRLKHAIDGAVLTPLRETGFDIGDAIFGGTSEEVDKNLEEFEEATEDGVVSTAKHLAGKTNILDRWKPFQRLVTHGEIPGITVTPPSAPKKAPPAAPKKSLPAPTKKEPEPAPKPAPSAPEPAPVKKAPSALLDLIRQSQKLRPVASIDKTTEPKTDLEKAIEEHRQNVSPDDEDDDDWEGGAIRLGAALKLGGKKKKKASKKGGCGKCQGGKIIHRGGNKKTKKATKDEKIKIVQSILKSSPAVRRNKKKRGGAIRLAE